MKLGEGRKDLWKGFSLSSDPHPSSPPNILTGGEAKRREFLAGRGKGCYTPSRLAGVPRRAGRGKTTTRYCPSNKEYRHG